MNRLQTLSAGILMLMAHSSQAALFTSATLDAKGTLTVRPPSGYHFNLEAPEPQLKALTAAGEQDVKPTKVSAAEAVVALPAGTRSVTARWFVCDDGKAVCLAVREELVVEGEKVTARQVAAPARPAAHVSEAPPAAGAVQHGFLVDRPDEALARAKKERRPLMVDFFGIWCPPCNALDETVFSAQEFERASEAFVKLKLDADRDTSWALKERWRVGGYPTVIFANADGEEIDRIVGSRSLQEFIARTEDALAHQNQPRSVLEKLAAGDPEADRRLARLQIERQECAPVVERLEKRQAGNASTFTEMDRQLLSRARIGVAKEAVKLASAGKGDAKAARAAHLAALKEALAADTGSTDAVDWNSTLAELLEEDGDAAGARAHYQKTVEAVQSLESKPDLLARDGLSRADLFQYKAGALDSLKDEAGTKAAFAAAAAEYAHEIKESGLSPASARGFNLERAYCLSKAGQPDEALAIYAKLEAAYPKEFTFLFAHSGLLHSLKRFDEAEPLARQALEHAYGDNRLRAAERLAKIQKERGQLAGARATVVAALKDARLPADPFNRTHRYVKALEALKKAIGK